jgi:hypothetical protein
LITRIDTVRAEFPVGTRLIVLIEEDPSVTDFGSPKGRFWLEDTVILVRAEGGSWYRGDVSDLQIGVSARGWYREDVLIYSTFPLDGSAAYIAID